MALSKLSGYAKPCHDSPFFQRKSLEIPSTGIKEWVGGNIWRKPAIFMTFGSKNHGFPFLVNTHFFNFIFSALELIHRYHSAKEITYFVVILQEKAAFGDKDCTGVKMVARRRGCHSTHGTSLEKAKAWHFSQRTWRFRTEHWGYH